MLATPLVGSPKWKTKVYSYIIVAGKNGKSRCTTVMCNTGTGITKAGKTRKRTLQSIANLHVRS